MYCDITFETTNNNVTENELKIYIFNILKSIFIHLAHL